MRTGTQSAESPRRRSRGRPRKFDPDTVLDHATTLFWARGFAATSLDELAAAMGMNRPSIANAFGDKEAVYRETLARFATAVKTAAMASLAAESDLSASLTSFYYAALDVYFTSDPAPGCFVMCTAPVEAVEHPRIRQSLQRLIAEVDDVLAARFARAKEDGQYPAEGDPKEAARMAQAILHSLAIRARSGTPKAVLRKIARSAAQVLAGG